MKMHLDRSNNHHRPSTLPQGLTCVRPPSSASSQHPITDPRPNLLHKVRQCVAFPLSCWATRKPPPPPSISTNPSTTFNIVGKMPPESLFARVDEYTRPSPMDWLPRSSMRAGALPSCPASWGEHRSRCKNLRMDVWLTAYSISHLRYPTAGTSSASEAQPFYVNSPFGLSMSINGNITNPQEVARFLDQEARRHVNTASDSELVLNVFANALNELGKARANVDDIFTALRDVYKRCIGAYSCVAMVAGFGLLAFRDSNGIRPLCLGSRPSATIEGAKDYFLASESIALTQLGFTDVVNIKPGEAVFIQKGGVPQFKQIEKRDSWSLDIFEMVYFARPDSELDGISVHRSRENMGRKLAKKIKDTLSKEAFDEIDVVIPVPETSNTSASILAQEMGKPFSNAFVKNRYIFRTFIPGQKARRAGIRRKLSCIKSEFKDRVVLLTDDSIVRGNTSREIVQMAKEAGAKKVLFVSCSPEIRYPHVHGIDLADRDELIAYGKTAEEVATAIGASEVVYQSLDDLKDACREAIQDGYEKIDFETGVFSGQYTTPVPEEYFEHLERLRSNKKRKAAAITESEGGAQTVLVASGGPVNVSSRNHIQDEDVKGPENREDVSIYNFAGKA